MAHDEIRGLFCMVSIDMENVEGYNDFSRNIKCWDCMLSKLREVHRTTGHSNYMQLVEQQESASFRTADYE